jgi:hypothetical protein
MTAKKQESEDTTTETPKAEQAQRASEEAAAAQPGTLQSGAAQQDSELPTEAELASTTDVGGVRAVNWDDPSNAPTARKNVAEDPTGQENLKLLGKKEE